MITDLHSRKIVGHCVYEDLSVKGSIIAFQLALKQRYNKTLSLIHHSARGVQYCSHAYVKFLQKNKEQISITQTQTTLKQKTRGRLKKKRLAITTPTKKSRSQDLTRN